MDFSLSFLRFLKMVNYRLIILNLRMKLLGGFSIGQVICLRQEATEDGCSSDTENGVLQGDAVFPSHVFNQR